MATEEIEIYTGEILQSFVFIYIARIGPYQFTASELAQIVVEANYILRFYYVPKASQIH